MLSSARPLFEHVPGSFADPVGLADQQGPGVVSLIVARYPDEDDCAALGTVYDCFVAVSGQLVAVARTTPDYRFPVTPAAALDRFLTARDSGRAVFVSLFETTEPDCARFLETVFYSECLKLHVDGQDSAALVADQLDRCGCGSGILELNDFSDPASPRVHLVDLDVLCATGNDDAGHDDAGGERETLTGALVRHLNGLSGRVLLYDREKNRAAIPGRAGGESFDVQAAIDQAARLADARRTSGVAPTPRLDPTARAASGEQTERVEAYLADRATRSVEHPQTGALSSLIGELSGATPAASSGDIQASGDCQTGLLPQMTPAVAPSVQAGDASFGPTAPTPTNAVAAPATPDGPPPPTTAPADAPPTATPSATPAAAAPVAVATPHPLARPLDELRVEVYALFEDAVNPERARDHEAHVCQAHAIPSPVPPDRVIDYLRALLCDAPPRRWHFFKQRRHDVRDVACRKLSAFHAAHNHTEHPVLHELTKLWSRLRK